MKKEIAVDAYTAKGRRQFSAKTNILVFISHKKMFKKVMFKYKEGISNPPKPTSN